MAGSLCLARRALAVALGLFLTCSPAFAQESDDAERNAARSLASQAKERFDRGDYEKAQDLFRRAYQLVQAPTISLYEARALVQLGRWVAAEEAYTRTVRTHLDAGSSDQFRKAVREAEPELAALQPRIPRLVINLVGAGARDPELKVALDGTAVKSALVGVEMPIDPGAHQLTAQAGAGPTARQSVTVQESERRTVELHVEAAPITTPAASPAATTKIDLAPPASRVGGVAWQKQAAFVAGGVGIAGLGLGIVSGMMASSRYSKAEQECPEHRCSPGSAGDEAVQSFRSLKTVSTVGYVIGGIGVAAGMTLFVTAPAKKPERAALSLFLSADHAGVAGVF